MRFNCEVSPILYRNKAYRSVKKDSWFSHIAVEVPGENGFAGWCDPVSDKKYGKL